MIASFVLERLQVINIRVSDEADAFLIFETINDRGRELDTLDLVKNLIFSRARGGEFDQVKRNWIRTMEKIDSLKQSSDFLAQYWTSMHGKYVKSYLFKNIRDEVARSKKAVVSFSESLYNSSKVFSAIVNVEDDFWLEYPLSTCNNIRTLKSLGAKAVNPIIMAAYESFDITEFDKLLKYLVVFQVRYVLICDLPTNKYSSSLSEIPPLIRDGTYSKAIKVAKELKRLGVYPADGDFFESFNNFSASSMSRVKYILSEIESYVSGAEKIVNRDSSVVNIEHVLSKNLSSADSITSYGVKSEEEYNRLCSMIGNLCLTNNVLNRAAKNKVFSEKKTILFENSDGIETTYMINGFSVWNKESIANRQKYLSEKALKVWTIEGID